MPEYLAPGVYVEEVSYRAKSIEGVSTTTTAFVGATRYGPLFDPPDILTSLQEYERVYGDGRPLDFEGMLVDNYMWQAVRAFFTEGGKRLYVKRIYRSTADPDADDPGGRAHGALAGLAGRTISVTARHPGVAGNVHVRFTLQLGQNVLALQGGDVKVRGLSEGDVVRVTQMGSHPTADWALAESYLDPATGNRTWRFHPAEAGGSPAVPASSPPAPIELDALLPGSGDTAQVVTVNVGVSPDEPGAVPAVWAALPLDPGHQLGGAPDSLSATFDPTSIEASGTPIVVSLGNDLDTGLDVLYALLDAAQMVSPPAQLEQALLDPESTVDERSVDLVLSGGQDGALPQPGEYEGVPPRSDDRKKGLAAFEDVEDVSIVAAPGSSFDYRAQPARVHAIVNNLIAHAQKMRYRIAVVDAGRDLSISEVRAMRAQHDTTYAAFYYPWVRILDPITGRENDMPPSGFVAGIYARNDIERAVYKAPANEVVNLAIGFERPLNKAQQEVLNPEGVNAFRFFEGRGYRLWGARTMTSDQEWKYVNLRRYFIFLEHSIDRGTQWAVFEPNGEQLWANVRRTIDDFLFDQWQNGALLGDKPEKAYFVRCDRSTMTQNDLDNGRLVCMIGVAPLRPAEFVIFRIGQWTADRKG
jgi:uncharacterized protein